MISVCMHTIVPYVNITLILIAISVTMDLVYDFIHFSDLAESHEIVAIHLYKCVYLIYVVAFGLFTKNTKISALLKLQVMYQKF